MCKDCKEAYTTTDEELRDRHQAAGAPGTLYRATVSGVQPHLSRSPRDLRAHDDRRRDPNLVSQNVDAKSIKTAATRKGMGTLRADGARKVLAGVTSVSEVIRATEEEGPAAQV